MSLFSSSFAGIHTPSVMGDLVLERGLENPRKQPRVGTRAHMPAAHGGGGAEGGPPPSPALFPSPRLGKSRGEVSRVPSPTESQGPQDWVEKG